MLIDSRDLRLLAVQGLTMAEIARELKQPYFRVRKSCQLYGVDVLWDVPGRPLKAKAPKAPKAPKTPKTPKAPRTPPVKQNAERNQRMASMYRQGLTLAKIGESFGITRERARQILRKLGITRYEGGQSKAAQAKVNAKESKREARYLARHGITFAKWKSLHGTGLLMAYRSQERAAKARGIAWGLNLAQWLDIWETSGKLDLRGKGKGKYLMSRIKDTGGYVIGNVHVQLATENSREAVAQWRDKPVKKNRGVFCLYPGLAKPYLVKVGKFVVGYFSTEDEGASARIAYINANGYRLNDAGQAIREKVAA